MPDQKQHAKITQQVRDLYKALNDCVSHSGSLQLLADALRDASLDEAKWWAGITAIRVQAQQEMRDMGFQHPDDVSRMILETARRASTPTLTAEDVKSALGIWSQDFPCALMASRLNAIIAAKSQKGGDANWTDRKKQTDLSNCSTDRASDTPSAAWDRAIRRAEIEARKEGQVPRSEGGNLARTDACDNVANAIRALRGKYEEPKASA